MTDPSNPPPVELTPAGSMANSFRTKTLAPLLYRTLGLMHLPGSWVRSWREKRRVAFVAPWFGEDIGGGAEAECRRLALELQQRVPDLEVHIITTCLKEFAADWNLNVHLPGITDDHGLTVHRCPVPQIDRGAFGPLNEEVLVGQEVESFLFPFPPRSPLDSEQEQIYLDSNITCPEMMHTLRKHFHYFDAFVFIPYLFTPTLEGAPIVASKAHVIPCLHEERYALLSATQRMMASVQSVLFHVPSEKTFAERCYRMKDAYLIGEMVDVDVAPGDPQRFRKTFGIEDPFILYTGRMIESKGVPGLVKSYLRFRAEHPHSRLQLVLLGKGDLDYSQMTDQGIHALGFVSEEDKIDAYAAATVFSMPSLYESFSISIMEAWLQNTPVMVPAQCAVTRNHVEACGGGWVYSSEDELVYGLEEVEHTSSGQLADCGGKGREYVLTHFTPERIVRNFIRAVFGEAWSASHLS